MDVQLAFKPFAEQLAFFLQKINMPTERWNDLWRDHHSHGFMVAGVAQMDLLGDIRKIVERAISGELPYDQFKAQFAGLVEKSGWKPNLGVSRRAEIIFETNVRQSFNAARWQQLTDPDALVLNPYLEYVHSPESKVPRVHHKAWDGLILRADDPWLETHSPQNGWMCRCKLRARSRRDLARAGKTEPDRAPAVEYYDWVDKKTGQSYKVPVGIDPGFDYNPGVAALNTQSAAQFGRKIAGLAPPFRARALADYRERAMSWFYQSQEWIDRVLLSAKPIGGAVAIGVLPESIMAREPQITNALVAVDDAVVSHFSRASKVDGLRATRADFLRDLPLSVGRYDAVLFDRKNNSYLLVRKVSSEEYTTLVIRTDFKNNKSTPFGLERMGWVRTIGQSKLRTLQSGFDLIEGSL